MATWSEEELARIEAENPDGLPATEIISRLEGWGVKFSDASLRKYVQLELLPRSVRVGHRGLQGGSQGQYPAGILRQILEIKQLLRDGYSIEEIRNEERLIHHKIGLLGQQIARLIEGLEAGIAANPDELARGQSLRALREARGLASQLLASLNAAEVRQESRKKIVKAAG